MRDPAVVGTSSVQKMSFTAIGAPASSPPSATRGGRAGTPQERVRGILRLRVGLEPLRRIEVTGADPLQPARDREAAELVRRGAHACGEGTR